jgi:hypothetical protein
MFRGFSSLVAWAILACVYSCAGMADETQDVKAPVRATLAGVKKIANDAPHSAFTDLIDWQGRLICAFREGRGHVSTDGRIALLASSDGETWERLATLTLAEFDLRDASLSVTPDGRLMLLGGASPRRQDGESAPTGSFVSFSSDGRQWTKPQIVVEPGRWLWRVTWEHGKAYGISYAAPQDHPTASLVTSADGVKYETLVPKLGVEGYPTEAVIRFDAKGQAFCLQRRDGAAAVNSAYLGVSRPPYDQWQWSDLHKFFGGPNLVQAPSGEWIAAGRLVRDGKPTTDVVWLDIANQELVPLLTLPSGGDTSYPGLVCRDDTLWVSYYSSHEEKTSIYVAKIELQAE